MDSHNFPSPQMSSFIEPKEQNCMANDAVNLKNDEVNGNGRRRRLSSSSGSIPRHAKSLGSLEAAGERNEPVNCVQDATSTAANGAFVGLYRRRKISLPSRPVQLKPDQFLEGGRVELAKREVNLDAHMPAFYENPCSVKKYTSTPIRKTEANGWIFGDNSVLGGVSVNQGPRQRRISLPVLKVDKSPDSLQPFTSYDSNSAGELSDNFLNPSSIPQVQRGPLTGKKAETRQWNQRL